MFCTNCGKEIDNNAYICLHCGACTNVKPTVVDDGNFLWGLLGFCFPIVGLILFLVWNDTKPKTAKVAGIGALIPFASVVLFYVLLFIVGIVASIFRF